MMIRVVLSSIVLPLLCFQNGCSTIALKATSLKDRTDMPLIDPNDGPYSIEVIRRNDGSRDYLWQIDSRIVQDNTCRVKYHNLYSASRFMVVDGAVQNTGNRYPIVLDTGASQPIFVKDTHILENKLAIYPIKTNKLNGHNLGLCHLPELQIGSVTLTDWPCLYIEPRTKLGLLGFSIAGDSSQDRAIIVGLPALREFKYIAFDSIGKEVEFSYNELFEPKKSQLWEQYPFSIEEDFHGNAFLFVTIPIAGEQIELQLDTGSGRGLAIAEELWEHIHAKIPNVKLRKATDSYPYFGRLACRRTVIPELGLGHRTIKNAKISIFPNESPLMDQGQGFLGMQHFHDTVIVLDFERNLMWVKDPQGQQLSTTGP